MSSEVFVCRLEEAPKRNLDQLKVALEEKLGANCKVEEHELGPWITIDGFESDMVISIDDDGTASCATLQCLDEPERVDEIVEAFIAIGWQTVEM